MINIDVLFYFFRPKSRKSPKNFFRKMNDPSAPKYHKWAAQLSLSKKSYRDYYYTHYGCLNFCKPSLGSFPTVSLLTILLTSIVFILSNLPSINSNKNNNVSSYLYFNVNQPLNTETGEFFIFNTGNPWYLQILTFFTAFFNATELQMYISNLLILFLLAIPLEMVHGPKPFLKLFFTGFLCQILASFFFNGGGSNNERSFMIIGSSIAIQSLVYAHMFVTTFSWSRIEKSAAVLRLIVLAFWLIQDNTWQLYRYYASIGADYPFSPVTMVLAPCIGATYGVILFYTYRAQDETRDDRFIKSRNRKEWSIFGILIVVCGSLVVLSYFV